MAIQTQTFSVGDYAYQSWSNGYKISLTLTQEQVNVEANTSCISYRFTISNTDNNRFISNDYNWNISIGGQTIPITGFDFYVYPYNVTQMIAQGQLTVSHNQDGSLDLSYNVSIPNVRSYTSYGPPAMEIVGTWPLTAIPRASTIGATDGNIGANTAVVVNRNSSAFTHSISYSFGSLSGYLTPEGGTTQGEVRFSQTTVAFFIPESFYGQIPKSKSGVCTLTCRTYSGTSKIGQTSATFIVTASEELCKPTLTASVVDRNPKTLALTGDENALVRYHSTALCRAEATARNAATVQQIIIDGEMKAEGTHTIEQTEKDTVTFQTTDSRGYSRQISVVRPVVPYVRLTNNATGKRVDATSGRATLQLKGNYFNGSFGVQDNTLTVFYSVNGGEETEILPQIEENSYIACVELEGLDYETGHTIVVTAEDKLERVTQTVSIGQGIPVFDWGQRDFRFNVPIAVQGAPLADFVIEEGSDTNWRWRKWQSGIIECWRTLVVLDGSFQGSYRLPLPFVYVNKSKQALVTGQNASMETMCAFYGSAFGNGDTITIYAKNTSGAAPKNIYCDIYLTYWWK